jgi:hypothetical protein
MPYRFFGTSSIKLPGENYTLANTFKQGNYVDVYSTPSLGVNAKMSRLLEAIHRVESLLDAGQLRLKSRPTSTRLV